MPDTNVIQMPDIQEPAHADRECEFCGDYIDGAGVHCAKCDGWFCSEDCRKFHLKRGAIPRYGGGRNA